MAKDFIIDIRALRKERGKLRQRMAYLKNQIKKIEGNFNSIELRLLKLRDKLKCHERR